jgi:hypothetical protein
MPRPQLTVGVLATRKWWFLPAVWLLAWFPIERREDRVVNWLVKHGFRYQLGIK